jgi:hypothetical protein
MVRHGSSFPFALINKIELSSSFGSASESPVASLWQSPRSVIQVLEARVPVDDSDAIPGQLDDPATSRRIFPPRCACATASLMDDRA